GLRDHTPARAGAVAEHVRRGARGGAGGRRRGGADRLSRVSRTDAAGRRRTRRARDRPGCAVGPLAPVPAHSRRGRVCCPMPATFRYIVALALCLVPGAVTGQGTAAAPPLAWWPRLPLQGSLVRLVVRPPPGASVTAVYGEL